jgi:hypothetical protein
MRDDRASTSPSVINLLAQSFAAFTSLTPHLLFVSSALARRCNSPFRTVQPAPIEWLLHWDANNWIRLLVLCFSLEILDTITARYVSRHLGDDQLFIWSAVARRVGSPMGHWDESVLQCVSGREMKKIGQERNLVWPLPPL